jgi:hypothetical protein
MSVNRNVEVRFPRSPIRFRLAHSTVEHLSDLAVETAASVRLRNL